MLAGRGAVRLGLYGAVLILMAGVLLGQTAHPAFAAAPPKPLTDWSYYVRTTSVQTFYNTGHNQGVFDHNAGSINSEVVLDFWRSELRQHWNSSHWAPDVRLVWHNRKPRR